MSNRQNLSNDRHEYRSVLFAGIEVGVDPAEVRKSLLRQVFGVPASSSVEFIPVSEEIVAAPPLEVESIE